MGGPLELTEGRSEEDDKRELVQQRGEDGTMEEEYNFNSQVKLEAKSYAWQDKYKPRKPRFFNRVHTVSVCVCVVRWWYRTLSVSKYYYDCAKM